MKEVNKKCSQKPGVMVHAINHGQHRGQGGDRSFQWGWDQPDYLQWVSGHQRYMMRLCLKRKKNLKTQKPKDTGDVETEPVFLSKT